MCLHVSWHGYTGVYVQMGCIMLKLEHTDLSHVQGTELWLSAAHTHDTCTQMHTWISNTSFTQPFAHAAAFCLLKLWLWKLKTLLCHWVPIVKIFWRNFRLVGSNLIARILLDMILYLEPYWYWILIIFYCLMFKRNHNGSYKGFKILKDFC